LINFNYSNDEKRNILIGLFYDNEKLLPNNRKFENNMLLFEEKIEVIYKDDNREENLKNGKPLGQRKLLTENLSMLENRNKEIELEKKIHKRKIDSLQTEISFADQCNQSEKAKYENEQKELADYWENLIKKALWLMLLLLLSKILFRIYSR